MTAGTARSFSLTGWRQSLSNTGFKITIHTYWQHYHHSTRATKKAVSWYTTRLETYTVETCVKARDTGPAFTLTDRARWLIMVNSWMISITGKALCAQNKTDRPIPTSTMASGLKAFEMVWARKWPPLASTTANGSRTKDMVTASPSIEMAICTKATSYLEWSMDVVSWLSAECPLLQVAVVVLKLKSLRLKSLKAFGTKTNSLRKNPNKPLVLIE